MTPDIDGNEPDEIARLLRERLPRHQAPTRLRASVGDALDPPRRRRPSLWLAPALSALATARTSSLLDTGQTVAQAATHGYQRALMAGAFFVLAAGVVALLARNTRETAAVEEEPALDLAA